MSNNQCGGDDDFVGDKRNSLNPLIYGGRGNLQREEQWGGGIDEILRVGQGKNRFGLRLRFFVTVHIRDSNLKPNICLSEVQENTIGDLKRKIEWEFEEIHKRKIHVEEIFVSQVFPINENNAKMVSYLTLLQSSISNKQCIQEVLLSQLASTTFPGKPNSKWIQPSQFQFAYINFVPLQKALDKSRDQHWHRINGAGSKNLGCLKVKTQKTKISQQIVGEILSPDQHLVVTARLNEINLPRVNQLEVSRQQDQKFNVIQSVNNPMRIHAPHESEDSEESSEKPVITVIEPKIKRKIVVDRQQEFEDGQVHANVYQQNQSHQLVERVQSKVESKFSQQTIQQAKEKAAAQKPNISEKTQKKQHHITMEDAQKKPKEATNSKIDGVKPNGEAKHKIKEAEKLNLQNSAGGAIKKKHTQIAGKPSELKKTQVLPVPPGKEPQAQRTSKNAPKTLEPIPKKDAGATQIPKIKANSQFRVPDKDEPTTPVLTIQNVNSKLQNFRGGGLQSSLQKLQQNDLKQSKKEEAQANRMATKFVKQSSVGPQNNSQPQENSEFSENAILQIKGKIQKKPDESLARNVSEEDDQRLEQEPIPSSESGNNSSPEKAQNLLQLEEESESELEISSTVKKEMANNPDDQESQRVKMDEADVQETSPNTNEVSHGDGSNIANVHKNSKLRQAAD